MVLDFEYGVNTANRFLQFVDHDEDPEVFIATQQPTEEKKTSKDSKQTSAATGKKVTSKVTTTSSSKLSSKPSTASATTKTNKENVSGKPGSADQRKQQSATVPAVFGDNNNQQQSRGDNTRGGRGGPRRGGYDRPPYEGGGRGGGQPRSARFNKFEGQPTNESSGFDQAGDTWGTDAGAGGNNDQGSFRGARGRGGPRRGNFEGGYGRGRGGNEGGRGRGRGGRGNFNNRSTEEGSQQQGGFQQDNNNWQQSTDSNFENSRPVTARTGVEEFDSELSPQDRSLEPDNYRRGGRGTRGRTFHSNRGNYGGDRQNQYEGGEGGQEDYRQNRRQYDRQPRTNLSGVKPIEKKDGEGAHNWGNPTENPEEHPITDETNETTAATTKDWAQQVDEAEKQMTLDEYKKQQEAKKKANPLVLPQFKTRTAGEGEDPKVWKEPGQVYRKKNVDDDSEGEGEESGAEESGSGEEDIEGEQAANKKKVITIPLRFTPIETPRGRGGERGSRRGSGRYDDRQSRPGGSGFRDRPARDDGRQPLRSTSPSQQQSPPSQQTGDAGADEQQQTSPQQYYRGAQRGGGGVGGSRGQGSARGGDIRRSYANSSRGPRGGGQGRAGGDPYAPALDNPLDFPTLPKQ